VLLMPFAGLISGVLTAALCGDRFSYSLGMPFGAVMGFCFAATGVTRSAWKLTCFFVLTSCSFYIAVFSAAEAELAIRNLLDAVRRTTYPTSYFSGGAIGGFLVLGGAMILTKRSIGIGVIFRRAFSWSLVAGVLAPIAWALGPSLGMWCGPPFTLQVSHLRRIHFQTHSMGRRVTDHLAVYSHSLSCGRARWDSRLASLCVVFVKHLRLRK
jgi:predicted lysophospholipase L1 biosynthesis ABC-type transport system permease subunit